MADNGEVDSRVLLGGTMSSGRGVTEGEENIPPTVTTASHKEHQRVLSPDQSTGGQPTSIQVASDGIQGQMKDTTPSSTDKIHSSQKADDDDDVAENHRTGTQDPLESLHGQPDKSSTVTAVSPKDSDAVTDGDKQGGDSSQLIDNVQSNKVNVMQEVIDISDAGVNRVTGNENPGALKPNIDRSELQQDKIETEGSNSVHGNEKTHHRDCKHSDSVSHATETGANQPSDILVKDTTAKKITVHTVDVYDQTQKTPSAETLNEPSVAQHQKAGGGRLLPEGMENGGQAGPDQPPGAGTAPKSLSAGLSEAGQVEHKAITKIETVERPTAKVDSVHQMTNTGAGSVPQGKHDSLSENQVPDSLGADHDKPEALEARQGLKLVGPPLISKQDGQTAAVVHNECGHANLPLVDHNRDRLHAGLPSKQERQVDYHATSALGTNSAGVCSTQSHQGGMEEDLGVSRQSDAGWTGDMAAVIKAGHMVRDVMKGETLVATDKPGSGYDQQQEWDALFGMLQGQHQRQMEAQHKLHQQQVEQLMQQQQAWLQHYLSAVVEDPSSQVAGDLQCSPMGRSLSSRPGPSVRGQDESRSTDAEQSPAGSLSQPAADPMQSSPSVPRYVQGQLSPGMSPVIPQEVSIQVTDRSNLSQQSHHFHAADHSMERTHRERSLLDHLQALTIHSGHLMRDSEDDYLDLPAELSWGQPLGTTPPSQPVGSARAISHLTPSGVNTRGLVRRLDEDFAQEATISSHHSSPHTVPELEDSNQTSLQDLPHPQHVDHSCASAMSAKPQANPFSEEDIEASRALELKLRQRHLEALGDVEQMLQADSGRSNNDPYYSSSVRLNLREKHSRHLADLRSFYEEEMSELKKQLDHSGDVHQRTPFKRLEHAHDELQRRTLRLQDQLYRTESTMVEQQTKIEELERQLVVWPQRYQALETQRHSLQHQYDELVKYGQEREAYVSKLETKSQEVSATLQEAYKLEDLRVASMRRDQEMMQKVLKEFETASKQNELLKASLSASENKLYDARMESADLKRQVTKLELEVNRLGHENDVLRYRGLSTSLSMSHLQSGVEDTSRLLDSSVTRRSGLGWPDQPAHVQLTPHPAAQHVEQKPGPDGQHPTRNQDHQTTQVRFQQSEAHTPSEGLRQVSVPQVIQQSMPQVSQQSMPQVFQQSMPQVFQQSMPQVSQQSMPQVFQQSMPQVSQQSVSGDHYLDNLLGWKWPADGAVNRAQLENSGSTEHRGSSGISWEIPSDIIPDRDRSVVKPTVRGVLRKSVSDRTSRTDPAEGGTSNVSRDKTVDSPHSRHSTPKKSSSSPPQRQDKADTISPVLKAEQELQDRAKKLREHSVTQSSVSGHRRPRTTGAGGSGDSPRARPHTAPDNTRTSRARPGASEGGSAGASTVRPATADSHDKGKLTMPAAGDQSDLYPTRDRQEKHAMSPRDDYDQDIAPGKHVKAEAETSRAQDKAEMLTVAEALEHIRSGRYTNMPEPQAAQPSKDRKKSNKGTKTGVLSSQESLDQRIQRIRNLEKRFDELQLEKRQLESQLNRMPAPNHLKHHQRQMKENLEDSLDKLDKELGSIRMSLKHYHVLKTST